jgi:hypothetical protein
MYSMWKACAHCRLTTDLVAGACCNTSSTATTSTSHLRAFASTFTPSLQAAAGYHVHGRFREWRVRRQASLSGWHTNGSISVVLLGTVEIFFFSRFFRPLRTLHAYQGTYSRS